MTQSNLPVQGASAKLILVVLALSCLISLIAEVITGLGGFVGAFSAVEKGHGGFPAARVGGPIILTVLVVALILIAISLISILSAAGLLGLLKGILLGVTLGLLIDYFVLRGKIERRNPLTIRRWAGRGAALTMIFCLWAGIINPALSRFGSHPVEFQSPGSIVGIFATTGFFVCAGFALIGLISYSTAKKA